MSKRNRGRQRGSPRPPAGPQGPLTSADPERGLLDQIASGALDPHLTAIAEAIRALYELLQAVGSAKALAQLEIGDRVQINDQATPRYLHGIHGTVVDLDDQTATVCVHRPVGRFKSGEILCPPLVLDRLDPAA